MPIQKKMVIPYFDGKNLNYQDTLKKIEKPMAAGTARVIKTIEERKAKK